MPSPMSPDDIKKLGRELCDETKNAADIMSALSSEFISENTDAIVATIIGEEKKQKARDELMGEYVTKLKLEKEIASGTYFGYTEKFWKAGSPSYDSVTERENWCKEKWIAFSRYNEERDGVRCTGPASYENMKKIVDEDGDNNDIYSPATNSGRSNRSGQAATSCDIFGMQNAVAQFAHILPASSRDREEWMGVAGAALGLDLSEDQRTLFPKLMKAVHGVAKRSDSGQVGSKRDSGTKRTAEKSQGDNDDIDEAQTKKKAKDDQADNKKAAAPETNANTKTMKSVETPAAPDTNEAENEIPQDAKQKGANNANADAKSKDSKSIRKTGTGVAHFPENLISLGNQAVLYDTAEPKVLIVPSMTMKEARKWAGGAYQAVVLAGLPALDFAVPYNVQPDQVLVHIGATNMRLVDKFLGMQTDEKRAKEQEILDTARQSLEETVYALHGYVKYMKKSVQSRDVEPIRQDTINRFGSMPDAELLIPKVREGLEGSRKPLLYLDFGDRTPEEEVGEQDVVNRHPAPDPLLLLFKAAVAWAYMTGVKLLANGEEDDDDECTSWDDEVLTPSGKPFPFLNTEIKITVECNPSQNDLNCEEKSWN